MRPRTSGGQRFQRLQDRQLHQPGTAAITHRVVLLWLRRSAVTVAALATITLAASSRIGGTVQTIAVRTGGEWPTRHSGISKRIRSVGPAPLGDMVVTTSWPSRVGCHVHGQPFYFSRGILRGEGGGSGRAGGRGAGGARAALRGVVPALLA